MNLRHDSTEMSLLATCTPRKWELTLSASTNYRQHELTGKVACSVAEKLRGERGSGPTGGQMHQGIRAIRLGENRQTVPMLQIIGGNQIEILAQ